MSLKSFEKTSPKGVDLYTLGDKNASKVPSGEVSRQSLNICCFSIDFRVEKGPQK